MKKEKPVRLTPLEGKMSYLKSPLSLNAKKSQRKGKKLVKQRVYFYGSSVNDQKTEAY